MATRVTVYLDGHKPGTGWLVKGSDLFVTISKEGILEVKDRIQGDEAAEVLLGAPLNRVINWAFE